MDKFARLFGRQYHLFDYVGAADAERVIVIMGSGVRRGRGDGRQAGRARRQKVGVLMVRLYRPFDAEAMVRRDPQVGQEPRRAGPHQRAGRDRASRSTRTSSPPWPRCWPNRPAARLAEGHRRALRPVVQGIHAGAWWSASSTRLRKPQPKRHFTVGINDDVTHLSLDYDPAFTTEGDDVTRGRVLRPGQRRHGERQPQLGEDRRREHAAALPGLLRLRLPQGRLGDHFARALQPAADQGLVPGPPGNFVACHQFHFLERIDMLSMAEPGRHVPAEQPLWPRGGLGPSAGRSAEADRRQEAEVLRGRRLQGGPRGRSWACGSTPSCRPASSSWPT